MSTITYGCIISSILVTIRNIITIANSNDIRSVKELWSSVHAQMSDGRMTAHTPC